MFRHCLSPPYESAVPHRRPGGRLGPRKSRIQGVETEKNCVIFYVPLAFYGRFECFPRLNSKKIDNFQRLRRHKRSPYVSVKHGVCFFLAKSPLARPRPPFPYFWFFPACFPAFPIPNPHATLRSPKPSRPCGLAFSLLLFWARFPALWGPRRDPVPVLRGGDWLFCLRRRAGGSEGGPFGGSCHAVAGLSGAPGAPDEPQLGRCWLQLERVRAGSVLAHAATVRCRNWCSGRVFVPLRSRVPTDRSAELAGLARSTPNCGLFWRSDPLLARANMSQKGTGSRRGPHRADQDVQ